MTTPKRPSANRANLIVAAVMGVLVAAFCYMLLRIGGPTLFASDFTYAWVGARAIAHGVDPYRAILTARVPWGPYMLYPAPAFIVALPVAWLPVQLAGALFLGLGSALLAFFLLPAGRWRLLLFVSAPMIQAAASVQWSPLLTGCALCVPAVGLLVAKPNLAIPLMAMQTRLAAWGSAILGGAAILCVCFLLIPHWVPEWLAALSGRGTAGQYGTPVLSRFGFVLALAILRWRRSEARLLLVMACIPQKMLFYDQLPLLLVPATRREMTGGVAASLVAYGIALQYPWINVQATTVTSNLFPLIVIGLYWPSLIMVLRRPNEGAAPAWLDRLVLPLPTWLRGSPRAPLSAD